MILTQEELKQLEKRIEVFEKETSAELVCMIADSSSDYANASFKSALLINTLLHSILLYLEWWQDGMHMLVSFVALFALIYLATSRIGSLKYFNRFFLSANEVESEVREAAFSHFFDKGLYKTREKNGVLLYLSDFERKIFLLADEGVFNLKSQGDWDQMNNQLGLMIKEGKSLEGILSFVDELEGFVKPKFPHRDDDTNELKNIMRV